MALLDKIPQVPKMEKFCCCLDLVTGVTYFSFGLIVIWIIYFIQSAIFGGVGGIIWAAMWSGANVLCYLAVVYGIKKSMKFFLLPALCINVFNVVVGVINAIINFVFLNLFGAIWLLAIAALTVYYVVALKNIWDQMASPPPQPEGGLEQV